MVYYTFMLQTKANSVDTVLIYGGASYQETGRGLAVAHQNFIATWKLFFTSHTLPGFEMLLLLCHYTGHQIITQYDTLGEGLLVMAFDTWLFWVTVIALLWTPMLFNPSGLNYNALRQDFTDWRAWMSDEDGWRAWWYEGILARDQIHWYNRVFIIARLCRFLFLSFAFTSIIAFRINMSDVDLFVYLVVALILLTSIKSFADQIKLLSPTLHHLSIAVLIIFFALLITLASVSDLIDPYNVYCFVWFVGSLAYGVAEMSVAFWGATAVKDAKTLRNTIRFFHFVIGWVTLAVPIIIAVFTTNFDLVQSRMLFNSKFVEMIRSGRREKAAKRHRGGQ